MAFSFPDPSDESAPAMTTIRVLIADDTPQVRQDLRTVLPLAGELAGTPVTILGEARDGREAVCQAQRLLPDLVIMDLEMPVLDGCEATREIKASLPGTRVLILSVHADPIHQLHASQSGADGFIVKGAPLAEIIHQINLLVHKGEN